MMAKTKAPKSFTQVAATGLREMPANAAWVLAKMLRPATEGAATVAEHVSEATTTAADSTRSVSDRHAAERRTRVGRSPTRCPGCAATRSPT